MFCVFCLTNTRFMQSYSLGSLKFVARLCCILLFSVIFFLLLLCLTNIGWSKGGAVVRALASHQYGQGWNPGFDSTCWLSLLLVLSFAPRGFSPGTLVFPSPQKPTLPNSNSIWNAWTRLNEFIWTLKSESIQKSTKIADSWQGSKNQNRSSFADW